MLTFEDCLGLSELNEDEILAIAEHEHIPELEPGAPVPVPRAQR